MIEVKETQQNSKLIELLEIQKTFNKILIFTLLGTIISIVFMIWISKPVFENFSLIIKNIAEDSKVLHDTIQISSKKISSYNEKDIDNVFRGIEDFVFILKNVRNGIEKIEEKKDLLDSINSVVTLLGRVKQDSDVLRKSMLDRLKSNPIEYLQYVDKDINNLKDEEIKNLDVEHVKNISLEDEILSPAYSIFRIREKISNELNFLNKNILIMSNNMMTMGHTMGRMGSWLP